MKDIFQLKILLDLQISLPLSKQSMLEGLLALEEELNMESIKVMEIVIPPNSNLLPNLRFFNLNHNDLAYLPKDMDQLKSLCVLKVRETLLT